MLPILRRELVTTLRSPAAVAAQALLAGVLAVMVLAVWPGEGRVDLLHLRSRLVLRAFGYGLLVCLTLLIPVVPAVSIVRERQGGTLSLLLHAPVAAWEIVAGKLGAALGYAGLLLAVSLPAAAACYALGGVELWSELGAMYAVLVVLGVLAAAVALLVSSYAGSTDGALRVTYGVMLGIVLVSVGPHYFLGGGGGGVGSAAWAADWLRSLSPLPAMMAVLGDAELGSGGLIERGGFVWRFCVLGSVVAIGCVAWTVRRLSGPMLDTARDAGEITDERSATTQAYRRVMYLWFFDPQRRSGSTPRWLNPVLVKEARTRRFGRSGWTARLIGLCLIASLGLMLAAAGAAVSQRAERLGAVVVLLQMGLIVLITPSLAGGLISSEVEAKSWRLLRVTPLSAGQIVRGKLMSPLLTLALLLLATLPGYAILVAIDPTLVPQVIRLLATLSLAAVAAVLVSAAVSAWVPHTAAATAIAYALTLLICGGTMLIWLGEDVLFSRSAVEAVLVLNPVAAALSLMRAPGFAGYTLVPGHWWFLGGVCIASLAAVLAGVWRLRRVE